MMRLRADRPFDSRHGHRPWARSGFRPTGEQKGATGYARGAPRGFTLIEIMAASVIASVIAGGTMMAFVTAARIANRQSNVGYAEASGYAQQTLEGIRNSVAADASGTFLSSKAGPTWYADPFAAGGGSESIQNKNARRCYRVTGEDCDGDGIPARITPTTEVDCYAVTVRVCWNETAGCPCP